ncbi:G2/M phase-specific E3 ubiquitin-protein ligase-like isoform X1 [Patella vulgata]|uniref:G2/M phase-specific E3 ubiquitin-protein ligase-like isoform X1 n=1 Tax=Patella vulgata TaxID=6465 RepID=UPI0021807EC1|nr:G2/M phase-specific E3 ubiquitin-protein ligase-like isoform X1 [Patella vulgata]XP_050411309.1 G2/M phase-specific E3 ubiquitin-protein ligase isoform X1 [Patella vulgata]XP_050418981.1 G2/M phase-specific E3 ubiquitin-protein ligase-like isoform X1 [Patella vulgata]
MIATFFPDGQAVHKNIKLSHCETFIGNFAGERVPSRLLNGDLFSLDGYFSEIKSNPVRLYLYAKTTTVNQPPSPSTSTTTLNQQTSATLNQPPSPSTSSTTLNQQPSATCTQPPSSSTSSTTLNQQTSATCTQPPSSSTSSTTLNQQTSATCTQPQLAINAVNYATNIINDDTDDELPDISFYSGTPTITFKKCKKAESLEEILVRLNSQIKNEKNIINVSRGDVLSGTRRAFSRKTFRPEFGLSVKFSGENGIDDGGPSRELLQLLMSSIKDSQVFQGSECKMLCPDIPSEERDDYRLFGKIISYSVIHRGPVPRFFSGILYDLIAFGSCEPKLDDIVDYQIREQIKELSRADDVIMLQEAAQPLIGHIDFLGAIPLIFDVKNKESLVTLLTRYFVVDRVKGVLNQFCEGMDSLGLRKEIIKNPEVMRELFVFSYEKLSSINIDHLFTPVFSENSFSLEQELNSHAHWRDFLLDLEETDELGSLLSFVTGLKDIPPLGFNPPLKLLFRHPSFEWDIAPFANTCANTLNIPVLKDYDAFKTAMAMSLRIGNIFTDA